MKCFFLLLSWLLLTSALAKAFSSLPTTISNMKRGEGWTNRKHDRQPFRQLDEVVPSVRSHVAVKVAAIRGGGSSGSSNNMAVLSWASSLGSLYASWLERRPIVTKSVTASLIFGLSDYLAQVLERSAKPTTTATPTTTISSKRILWSMLVGLLYFGPAAHFWYGTIFRLLPGTSLWSTLQKAALGQLIFGPSFTCIFFATALIQSGQWSFNAWFRKIAQDLPKAWLAGAGFWPLMDLISYSYISREWIPLFINCCSLVWTIYLSLIANKRR